MGRFGLFDPAVTLCFTGHRDIPPADCPLIRKKLKEAAEQAYGVGYRVFLCGGARGFDLAAAVEIIRMRADYPDIRLILVIPCTGQADRWDDQDRMLYQFVLNQADEKIVLSDFYYKGCMQVRNRFMVDASSLCLCYMTRFEGGTWSTVRYALQRGIHVKNLAMPDNHPATMRERPWNSIFISPSAQKNASIVHSFHFRLQKLKWINISVHCSGKRK